MGAHCLFGLPPPGAPRRRTAISKRALIRRAGGSRRARAGAAERHRTLAAAITGYVLGTVPSADVAARAASDDRLDLRDLGSGNPGAINAITTLGPALGIAVAVADVAKGAAACSVGRRLAGPDGAHVAGVAAVTGHCYPAWRGLRGGGKGVATSVGQCLATFPVWAPVDVAIGVAIAAYTPPGRRGLIATTGTAAAWVLAGVVWWRRGWPNAWGPKPTTALPLANLASTAVILSRFAASLRRRRPDDLGDA